MRQKPLPLTYYLGNAFMALSLFVLFFIYYPVAGAYLFPPKQTVSKDSTFSISIPKIHLLSPVVANVDAFDQTTYRNALTKGIAHAKGTKLPGQKGTIFLFGHSSDAPWRLTRYNTVFLRLGELEKGDTIYIAYRGKEYTYKVIDEKTVWPNEVGFLTQQKSDQLILQTCTPIGTDLQRLLVFAKPV